MEVRDLVGSFTRGEDLFAEVRIFLDLFAEVRIFWIFSLFYYHVRSTYSWSSSLVSALSVIYTSTPEFTALGEENL